MQVEAAFRNVHLWRSYTRLLNLIVSLLVKFMLLYNLDRIVIP